MDLITEQRLARRAAILEAARQMLAERGYEAVTVRDLAEICRVSVPTLYNQFGGKDQLLAAAIEEHFLFALDNVPAQRAAAGHQRLLMIIDQCAEQLLNLPNYHRRLLEAFASLSSTLNIQERIARKLTATIAAELRVMASKRQVATWVLPDPLAAQMTAACIGTAIQWSAGGIDDQLLAPQMRYTMALVVLGVLRGVPRERFESRVRLAQQQLQAGLPVSTSKTTPKTGANLHG